MHSFIIQVYKCTFKNKTSDLKIIAILPRPTLPVLPASHFPSFPFHHPQHYSPRKASPGFNTQKEKEKSFSFSRFNPNPPSLHFIISLLLNLMSSLSTVFGEMGVVLCFTVLLLISYIFSNSVSFSFFSLTGSPSPGAS